MNKYELMDELALTLGISASESEEERNCNELYARQVLRRANEVIKNKSDQAKEITTEFYYNWHNSAGTNTDSGFDSWWIINKYKFGFWEINKPFTSN